MVEKLASYLGVVDGKDYDHLLVYYILKVSDLMKYDVSLKVSMMGRKIRSLPLIEKFKFSLHSKHIIETSEFWSNYFRQNKGFLLKNWSLLEMTCKKLSQEDE